MPDRKAAIINVSKGLLNVSFVTLAAIGSATGNPAVAGISALPQALASSGMLKSLLERKQEEHLELPVPPWWTGEPQLQTWQATCSSIEYHLPKIIKGVEERLRKEKSYPSSSVIKQIFIEQVAQQLSSWEVELQDRTLVAGYVTPLLLERSAAVLKGVIDATREDALAQWLAQMAATLDTIQKAPLPSLTGNPATPGGAVTQSPKSVTIAALLEQKRLQQAYDVYICYDEEDEVEVMKVGGLLKARTVLPWFDGLDVRPGAPKKLQQEEQIMKVHAAAVFIGQHAIARGQLLQIYAFIQQYIDRECAIIPVLLPDAPKKPELPSFLAEFGWVDFRKQEPDPMKQLVWGITGARP
jgi:TIR domain